MICQNCQAEVDNDLVFCTECGSRLHQTVSNAQTVVMPESVVTKISETIPQKKSSSLKWIALVVGIVVVIALPASLIIAYFALSNPNKTVANKSANNTSANKKSSNQNKTANVVTNQPNSANDWSNKTQNNSNENVSLKPKETKIIDEQINVDAGGNIAFPFKVREGMVKMVGETEILNGDQFEGYVFLQEVYDENGVQPDKKVFSFDSDKSEQYLTKGNYVLVFVNGDGKGVSLKTKFTLIPQDSDDSDKN